MFFSDFRSLFIHFDIINIVFSVISNNVFTFDGGLHGFHIIELQVGISNTNLL